MTDADAVIEKTDKKTEAMNISKANRFFSMNKN
jgi:hypothetical protein